MIQKITQNNGNFWTVNLIMQAKIVNQSSDFPVRCTGSYRHKKALITVIIIIIIRTLLDKQSLTAIDACHCFVERAEILNHWLQPTVDALFYVFKTASNTECLRGADTELQSHSTAAWQHCWNTLSVYDIVVYADNTLISSLAGNRREIKETKGYSLQFLMHCVQFVNHSLSVDRNSKSAHRPASCGIGKMRANVDSTNMYN